MTSSLLCLTLLVAADPAGLPLFAEAAWYKEAREAERLFEGTLERNPGTGRAGKMARFNVFRLTWIDSSGKAGGRELYLPEKAVLLAEHLGEKLRVVGKAVDVEVEGVTYHELWPARVEFPKAALTPVPPTVLVPREGILARCYWHPEAGLQRQPRLYVFRTPEQMVEPLRLSGRGAGAAASALMAQKLGVEDLDWNKHMLVCVCAGLGSAGRLTITRTEVKERVLTIHYRTEGAAGLGVAAETVLVERFEGEVRLQAE